MRRDINHENDVKKIVYLFYEIIKLNEVIGDIFKKAIPKEQWDDHLDKLTNFWNTNVFGIQSYKGNPVRIHKNLDKENTYGITQIHFFEWLKLWNLTIDENYEGNNANHLKLSARHISTRLFIHICNGRPRF